MTNYLLPFLMILLLWQCQDEALLEVQPQEAAFGKAFVLGQGEQLKVTGDDTAPLELKVEEVNDSRCPEDVVCVWLGNATVALKLSNPREKNKEVSLCIGDCRPEPVRSKHNMQIEVGGQKYEITLLEVLPYPNTSHPETEKQVKLLVNKTH